MPTDLTTQIDFVPHGTTTLYGVVLSATLFLLANFLDPALVEGQSQSPAPRPQSARSNSQALPQAAPTMLVESDLDCTFAIDDQPKQSLKAGDTVRISATLGQHLVTAVSADGKDHWKTVVDVDKPAQKVVLIELVKVRAERQAAERQVAQLKQEIAAKEQQAKEVKEKTQALAEQQNTGSRPATVVAAQDNSGSRQVAGTPVGTWEGWLFVEHNGREYGLGKLIRVEFLQDRRMREYPINRRCGTKSGKIAAAEGVWTCDGNSVHAELQGLSPTPTQLTGTINREHLLIDFASARFNFKWDLTRVSCQAQE
jgi:hypothetical protein